MVTQPDQRVASAPPPVTDLVADLLAEWSASCLHWRPSTRIAAESYVRAHLLPYWGSWSLEQIRRRDVQIWVASLKGAPRTVDTIHGRLLTFLNWCVEEQLISTNPARKIHLPPSRYPEHRFLTVEQVSALAAAMGQQYRPLLWLLATCGLRIGEAVELRVRDLDLARQRIQVERSVVFVNGAAAVAGPPESGRGRSVAITAQLGLLLATAAQAKGPQTLLFTTVRGHQIRPNNFKRREFDPAVCRVNKTAGQIGGGAPCLRTYASMTCGIRPPVGWWPPVRQ